MAERRMFAKTIIDSDAFLDMPLSTQALYFHLSMRADDDGFINNAKKIQRMLGCSDDDMKILLAKNFIIPFETGVCVIKHWKIHNLIQKDRYKPTVYNDLKDKLSIKNNNVYTLDTECIQVVSSLEPQVSIGKASEVNTNDEFNKFWEIYPKKLNKADALKAWKSVNVDLQTILDALKWQTELPDWRKDGGQFIPYPASYLRGKRWEDERITSVKRGLVF